MDGQGRPIRVLLVESNPGHAWLLEEALDFGGGDLFEVLHAQRLEEARRMVATHEVDVALLDLFLPDSFGFGTIVGFQQFAPQLPVVAMSGMESEDLGACCRQLGARGFFCKQPLDGEALIQALMGALGRSMPGALGPPPPPHSPEPAQGQVIHGRWVLDALLAEGGMGVVYRGRELATHRPVAVKFIHPNAIIFDDLAQSRFLREALILSALDHPNIPRLLDYGINPHSAMPYMVVEFMRGKTLCERFAEVQSQPLETILQLVLQVLRALEAVHKRGVVHRDIKPSNIFLEELPGGRLRVRLFDFGVSRFAEPGAEDEQYFGTPEYMPPEQIYGALADHRADLYALGVTFYELLTGRTPYQGNLLQIYQQQQLGAPSARRLWMLREDPDDRLLAVVDWMMTFERDQRPSDASHVREILEEILAARRFYDGRPERAPRAAPNAWELESQHYMELDDEALPSGRRSLAVGVSALAIVASLLYIFMLH
jgi:DNA-binding response OmpR family regulator